MGSRSRTGADGGRVRVKMATRSEALQQVLHRGDCPYLLDCGVPVTKNFFNHLCNSARYTDCHHYARRAGEIQAPLVWLQKLAMHEEGRNAPQSGQQAVLAEARR